MSTLIAIILIILLVFSAIMFFVGIYNRLVMLKFNVEKAYANIDVTLKQRVDEIPNLVETAKQFLNHEKELLTRLTELRTHFHQSLNSEDKTKIYNEMSKSLASFFAVSENYPTLTSNINFVELQKRISEIENKIADRREFFNDSVNLYNIGINEFPNVILAKMFSYTQKSLLEINDSEKKYDGVQF